MDSIHSNNKKTPKLEGKATQVNNENSKPSVVNTRMVDKKNKSDKYYMLRLKEIETHNAHLEKIVEQQKVELADIIATNSKFISLLAHDLRSPIGSILGVLNLVTESLKNNNIIEVERYIKSATSSVNNTLSLLDNLLVWIISQQKGDRFKPVKIDLQKLIQDKIDNLSVLANQKQISLKHCLISELYVTADLQMVKSIFRNLITNAIKFTHTNGTITISALENNQYVEIAIEDNGVGISFEAQKKLFKIDSFQSTIGTKNEKGTGLGLIICKDFIEKHGGNIWIESEQGKGSEFKFTLPHYI